MSNGKLLVNTLLDSYQEALRSIFYTVTKMKTAESQILKGHQETNQHLVEAARLQVQAARTEAQQQEQEANELERELEEAHAAEMMREQAAERAEKTKAEIDVTLGG